MTEPTEQNWREAYDAFLRVTDDFFAHSENPEALNRRQAEFAFEEIAKNAQKLAEAMLASGITLSQEEGQKLRTLLTKIRKIFIQVKKDEVDDEKEPLERHVQRLFPTSIEDGGSVKGFFYEEKGRILLNTFLKARRSFLLAPWRAPILLIYSPRFSIQTITISKGGEGKIIHNDILDELPDLRKFYERVKGRGLRVILWRPAKLERDGGMKKSALLFKELTLDRYMVNLAYSPEPSLAPDGSIRPMTRFSQAFRYMTERLKTAMPALIFADADDLPSQKQLDEILERLGCSMLDKNGKERVVGEASTRLAFDMPETPGESLLLGLLASAPLDMVDKLPAPRGGNPNFHQIEEAFRDGNDGVQIRLIMDPNQGRGGIDGG